MTPPRIGDSERKSGRPVKFIVTGCVLAALGFVVLSFGAEQWRARNGEARMTEFRDQVEVGLTLSELRAVAATFPESEFDLGDVGPSEIQVLLQEDGFWADTTCVLRIDLDPDGRVDEIIEQFCIPN